MNSFLNIKSVIEQTPVVIFAGGLGTRLSEETANMPKPMVPIGGLPIIVHIMDCYSQYGFRHFVICGGYRINEIKNFFLTLPYVEKNLEISFSKNMHDVSVVTNNNHSVYNRHQWKVSILETGLNSMTGSRMRQAIDYLNENYSYENLCLTYGDGLTDANLHEEMCFHLAHKGLATVLAVHNPGRFGTFEFNEENKVTKFSEKPKEYINGGYFLFKKGFEKYLPLDSPTCVFEKEPLEQMARDGELYLFRHNGFWQCMDTKRDKDLLEEMWSQENRPWLKEIK